MRAWWLLLLVGCGGDPFVAAQARPEALEVPDTGEGGRPEASTPEVSVEASPDPDAATVEAGTPDTGSESAPATDAAEEPETSPPWQLACFGGQGAVPEGGTTTLCQPMGAWSKCSGCAAAFGYSCWDDLPPTSDCAVWSGNPAVFCCASNVCTLDDSFPIPCAGATPHQRLCAAGVSPPAGCVLQTSGSYCCPA